MNDHNILPVEQAVDLGVSVDREMKFSLHIANISRKAHKRANLIIRCFHSKNIQSLVASYKVYVRPILEYSSVELDSLELRRVRADLLFTYKLVFGLIDVSLHDFFVPCFNEARRGHDYKL